MKCILFAGLFLFFWAIVRSGDRAPEFPEHRPEEGRKAPDIPPGPHKE